MALNFPSSPTNGQTYTYGTKSWTYDSYSAIFSFFDIKS